MSYFNYEGSELFYSIKGNGAPLILLHGNTASSKMFASEIKLYSRYFTTISVDYPGHGRSSRLPKFPLDFWYHNAMAVIALCEQMDLSNVNLLGCSGGGIIALNMALEAPELVSKLLADSLPGLSVSKEDALRIKQQRENSNVWQSRLFWLMMHGWHWKEVVEADTAMLLEFADKIHVLYHRDLSQIQCPVLVTASLEDDEISDIKTRMEELAGQIPNLRLHFFSTGGHPAMFSSKKEFRQICLDFLVNS